MRKRIEPQYHLLVSLTGNRRNKQAFFTLKAARHYAKEVCNNPNVQAIDLTGIDIPSTRLYQKGE